MTQQQAPKARIVGVQSVVPIDSLDPNPWNPNVQSDFMFEKERESIRVHGFIDPITVRSGREKGPMFKRPQILDGEHRWKGGKLEGMTEVPIVDLGRVSDARAKVITEVMNKLRGENDPLRWSEMIMSIQAEEPGMLAYLPYEEAALTSILKSSEVDWGALDAENAEHHASQRKDAEGKLFKKFAVSVPEATMAQALDLMRRIKAAHKIDDDAAAFKVLLGLAEQGLGARRASVVPPPPAPAAQVPQGARRRRRERAA
jgi:hypothetical protein